MRSIRGSQSTPCNGNWSYRGVRKTLIEAGAVGNMARPAAPLAAVDALTQTASNYFCSNNAPMERRLRPE